MGQVEDLAGKRMKTGLTFEQLDEIRKITSEYSSVVKVMLFGSRAMGTYSPASDVDLVLMGKDISIKDQIRISSRLNESKSLLKYDVVRYSTIKNEKLIAHIKKYGVVVFESESIGAATSP